LRERAMGSGQVAQSRYREKLSKHVTYIIQDVHHADQNLKNYNVEHGEY
jgi:hypothetical protein